MGEASCSRVALATSSSRVQMDAGRACFQMPRLRLTTRRLHRNSAPIVPGGSRLVLQRLRYTRTTSSRRNGRSSSRDLTMPSLVHELDADLKPVLVLAWCHWSSIFCLLVKIVSCFEFFSQLAFSQLASSRATESCTLCAFGVTGHPFFCLLVNFVFF